jgi:hypothetical protein
MNTHADKTQENKSQSVSNGESQMQSGGESTFQFIDNRPESVAQRKLQEMADNSPQVSQLRAFQDMANNSPQAKQTAQLQVMADNNSAQQLQHIQKKENNTGLPDNLKTGMESLSGMSLDDVKVHRNSDKPAQLQAHAYAQGTDIHLGPRQEKHLPHEAWHVVQQKQGRVKPTMQMKSKVNVNDDAGLEKEADVMGAKALQTKSNKVSKQSDHFIGDNSYQLVFHKNSSQDVIQGVLIVNSAKIDNISDPLISSISEGKLARAKELILSKGDFTFPSEEKLNRWLDLSIEITAVAKNLHEHLYNVIKTDIESKNGTIGDSSFSTTGILMGRAGLEVACNFAVTPQNGEIEGRPVTLDEVIEAFNSFPGGSPLPLGPGNLKIHNASPVIDMSSLSANPDIKQVEADLIGVNWAKELSRVIGVNWESFAVHADVVLMSRSRSVGIENPVIGISKAPCELCHGDGVTGRDEVSGSGLKGNVNINTPNKGLSSEAIPAIKGIIEHIFNARGHGYVSEDLNINVKLGKQSVQIKIPRWIPTQFLTYSTEESDVITIEVDF